MELIAEVVFDQGFLTIYHRPELKQIHLKWKGYATSQEYREGLETALKLVEQKSVHFWLGDRKFMQAILPQDEDWSVQQWMPKLQTSGLKKMAIVTSLDFLNNSSMKRILSSRKLSSPEIGFFVDETGAAKWLEEGI